MFLATTTAANSGVMSTGMLIMWLVIMFGMMYFLMIRPQKKEQKKLQAMLNDLAVGDAVVLQSIHAVSVLLKAFHHALPQLCLIHPEVNL